MILTLRAFDRTVAAFLPARAVFLFVLLILIATGACAAIAPGSFDAIKAAFQPSETRVVDRNGELLQRVRTDPTVRRGQWVALQDMSPALRTAMLLSEDRRFYGHSGVDWRAVSAAAWGRIWHQRTRGASTITMQLAGLIDDDLRRGRGGRSVVQKVEQTLAARQLETSWRKDQILEAYLNLVPFRGEIVGIDALSRTLFDKLPSGLDEREAAVTAVLVRAPNAGVAVVSRRACSLLRELKREPGDGGPPRDDEEGDQSANNVRVGQPVDCFALRAFTEAALSIRAFDASDGVAPHLARQAIAHWRRLHANRQANAGGDQDETKASPPVPATLRTTLSAPLQRFATATLAQQLRELQGRHVEDGAVVVLDNASGEVLAWVGSSGALSKTPEVDGVLALRQPGSALKPFLYAEAIAERRLTAASLVHDSPEQLPTASGLYIPQNYDRRFKGWVSVRTALAASLNVPAVRTLEMVSPDAFFHQLQAVGLPLRESGGYFGYSLALGSAEVSLVDLANAYRTLARGGRYTKFQFLPLEKNAPVRHQQSVTRVPTDGSQGPVVDPRAAFIVGNILSDPNARARTFGSDSLLATPFWTAVKTGTSKDMRDNWAVGWSSRYTVAVWVGNASGAPMWDVSGISGAAPIWVAVMRFLHRSEPSVAPVPPPGVVRIAVRFEPALEASRAEWFLSGTEQPVFAHVLAERAASQPGDVNRQSAGAHILSPAAGTVVALDPDIPPENQQLWFEASDRSGAVADFRWWMDGQAWAQGRIVGWLPWPGRHKVQLRDTTGTVLDTVAFEVRGAGARLARPPARTAP